MAEIIKMGSLVLENKIFYNLFNPWEWRKSLILTKCTLNKFQIFYDIVRKIDAVSEESHPHP